MAVASPTAMAAMTVAQDAEPTRALLSWVIARAPIVLVTMAYPTIAITRPLDASGFLVPRTEGLLMTATS